VDSYRTAIDLCIGVGLMPKANMYKKLFNYNN